jgi:hypothetical protein
VVSVLAPRHRTRLSSVGSSLKSPVINIRAFGFRRRRSRFCFQSQGNADRFVHCHVSPERASGRRKMCEYRFSRLKHKEFPRCVRFFRLLIKGK